MRSRAFIFVITLLWTGFLFYLGVVPSLPEVPNVDSSMLSNLGHFGTHAVLASLLYLLFTPGPAHWFGRLAAAFFAFCGALTVGFSLELVQYFLPDRDASWSDVAMDTAGAFTGVVAIFVPEQLRVSRAILSAGAALVALGGILMVTAGMAIVTATSPREEDCGPPPRLAASPEAASRSQVTIAVQGEDPARVTLGLVALYEFTEGSGVVVRDSSGLSPGLDLKILDPRKVRWLPGGGVEFVESGSAIQSAGSAPRLYDALSPTGRLTVEAWAAPANLSQEGPVRIVTMSDGPERHQVNFHLGQDRRAGTFRLRTLCNLRAQLHARAFHEAGKTTHVVMTYDGAAMRMYVDGEQHSQAQALQGDFSNWSSRFPLTIGNEVTLDRSYLGKVFLIAIYNRTLTPEEVRQNFEAGLPGGQGGG